MTSIDEKTVVNSHSNDLPFKLAVNVKARQDKLPTMYWLPNLHKRPYKARLTSCLTAVKSRVNRYYETVHERSRKHMFWSIKILAKYLVN